MGYSLVGQSKDYEHDIECIPAKNTALKINVRLIENITEKKITLKENILFDLGIDAETVVDTNISDMCTIQIYII